MDILKQYAEEVQKENEPVNNTMFKGVINDPTNQVEETIEE